MLDRLKKALDEFRRRVDAAVDSLRPPELIPVPVRNVSPRRGPKQR
jgi:hypothetical protein